MADRRQSDLATWELERAMAIEKTSSHWLRADTRSRNINMCKRLLWAIKRHKQNSAVSSEILKARGRKHKLTITALLDNPSKRLMHNLIVT